MAWTMSAGASRRKRLLERLLPRRLMIRTIENDPFCILNYRFPIPQISLPAIAVIIMV
jgi:hypothetical protein